MSTELNQVIIEIGQEQGRNFSRDCEPGDWETFEITFPTQFPDKPRVIVTANDFEIERGLQTAAVVGVARKVSAAGFELAARNSDCARGNAGFNWMAVLETPGRRRRRVPEIRMGAVQPRHFQSDCNAGDWQSWGINFSGAFGDAPITLLTASNLNITPFQSSGGLRYHNAAAVGVAQHPAHTGFTLAARNSDCAEGDCAFSYVSLSEKSAGTRDDLIVDSGLVPVQSFAEDCKSGDWQSSPVTFSQPFLVPPIVLVTANDLGVQSRPAAVVGITQGVSPYGFTLAGRNSDCADGQAGFYWVAIGCARGCG